MPHKRRQVWAVVFLGVAIASAAHGQTFNELAELNGLDGAFPTMMSLVQGPDGSLYGTTMGGGLSEQGVIFKITRRGVYSALHKFAGTGGAYPFGHLVLATDGNFYGTTSEGGAYGSGTIFKVTANGALTTLYSFSGGTDGFYPVGGLIQAADGQFYGTTVRGGAYDLGTVFEFTSGGTLKTLWSFCATAGCPDGEQPFGTLVQGTDGSLYGTTVFTDSNDGTIFKVTPAHSFITLHSFSGADGSDPESGLFAASDGNFYGTTRGGGGNEGGTVFKITSRGVLTTVYAFCVQVGCPDGESPVAPLVEATDGSFYGTAHNGGGFNYGTIFQVTRNGTETVLHVFEGSGDGAYSTNGLLQATDGLFYGATEYGGTGQGMIFSLDMGLAPFVAFVRDAGKVSGTGGILGQEFTGSTNVSLNGTPVDFTVVSDTFIKATVPAGATTGFVTVNTPSGTLTSNKPFRVTPQFLSFNPPNGPVGTQVTITGVSLTQTLGVGFGDRVQSQFTVNSDTQVTATVPAGAKTGKIGIETKGGVAISSGTFTVTE